VVQDRQEHGFQQHGLGERRLDDQHRRAREEDFAVGVAGDVAAEPVVGQPVAGRLVDHAALAQELDRRRVEAEALQRVEQPVHARHHAVPASVGQSSREQLEDRTAVRRAVGQRGLQHGQLVVVGEQGGRRLR
jgi:hypothetical protein